MSRRALTAFTAIVLAGIIVVGGAAAYVLRAPAVQTGEITAIPLATNTELVQPTASAAVVDANDGMIIAEVAQEESEARFIVDEILNNQPKTVVGVTNQVAAQLAIDPQNPANVQLGIVQVDVRSLVTDSNMRNRAIQNFVLQTRDFEYATFAPMEYVGLPTTAQVGDTFSFQIIGELTIKDITRTVTFDVTVTIESEQRLSGLAVTTISRDEFQISIPQVAQVAGVDDDVRLELEFVAVPVEG